MCFIVLLIKSHPYLFDAFYISIWPFSEADCQKIQDKIHLNSEWRIQDLQSSQPGLYLYNAISKSCLTSYLELTLQSLEMIQKLKNT